MDNISSHHLAGGRENENGSDQVGSNHELLLLEKGIMAGKRPTKLARSPVPRKSPVQTVVIDD